MSRKPNVIVFTTHDTGRHFGCYGVETVHSPRLDALAAEGVLLTDYYATAPVCSPSRGAMLTGRYPQRNGLMGLVHSPWWWEFKEGERHLSHLFRDAGYETCLFGVQHETLYPEAKLGFTHVERNGRETAAQIAERVSHYLRRRKPGDPPFYAQVGTFETHTPFDWCGYAPDEARGVYVPPFLVDDAPARRHMAGLQGCVRAVDAAVGQVLDALEESGQADNTIFVYTTDHGIEMPRAKWTCFDAGLQTALIMRWPGGGIVGGQRCSWLLNNVDFTPTVLDLAGVEMPDNLDGRSFARGLRDPSSEPTRHEIYGMYGHDHLRYVRTRRHKLIRCFNASRQGAAPYRMGNGNHGIPEGSLQTTPYVQLFDLDKDPYEYVNRADHPEYAGTRAELDGRLWMWMEQVEDPLLDGVPPSPYYRNSIDSYHQWRGIFSPGHRSDAPFCHMHKDSSIT